MSDPYQSPLNDLFNFPEVEGLEEFGLVPPVPASMRAAQADAKPMAAPAAQTSGPSSSPSEASEADSVATPAAKTSARPNPPTPEGIDLDEDLFHFDELFSLDDDPYRNGTLNSDGLPANDLFLNPTPAAPAVAEPAPAAAAPTPAPQAEAQPLAQAQPQAQVPPQPGAAPQSQPQAAQPSQPQTDAYSAPLPSAFPTHRLDGGAMAGPAAAAAGNGNGYALRDRGPRILLPEDIPYSQASEKQRLLWILVACFLLVNTGIFYVATQASAAFQSSLQVTTDKLADAIAQDKAAPAPPSPFPATSASVGIDPAVTHTVSTQPILPAGSDLPERSQRDRWIDPRDYANTHEFAVGNAKALLAEGRFEDARRLLNHVLANQARIPLSPVLREEIDYLIPLTYFEQGNATAPTPEKRP